MNISNDWVKITTTAGNGVQLQKHGLVPLLVAYAEVAPTTESVFVVKDGTKKVFEEALATEFIWARSYVRDTTVSVEETVPTSALANKNGGFIDYNDTATSTAPISLLSGVWTRVPNNGLGAFTNKAYLPYGVTELMTSDGFIDPTELSLGDIMLIRNDYTITPSTNNQSVQFRYTLGGNGGEYFLNKTLGRMDEGSGIPYRYSLNTDEIYMGDLNTQGHPIGIEVKTSGGGNLVNAGTVISVIRRTV